MLSRLNGLALLAGMTALGSLHLTSAYAAGDAAPAAAAAAPAAVTELHGDPVIGEKKFYTCVGCHGIADYKNAYPDYSVPKLRHQNAAYIVSALHEYQAGERPHPTMHAQASSLSDQDMEDIAAYLQGPTPVSPGPASAAAPPQVAACAACHGETGLGVAAPMTPKPPVLAGQHVSYLEQALTTYKNGRRKNVVMNGMAALLTTDDDVKIAAAYFAGLPSPLATATTSSK